MYSTASKQIGSNERHLDEVYVTSEQVEIVALSDERSQEAARILHERRQKSNPVQAYVRNLNCEERPKEEKKKWDDAGVQVARDPVQLPNPVARLLFKYMPILSWLPKMRLLTARADIIAGCTVGVMVIPQGMSYASIAGLPLQYGMYAACMPAFVYALFGQSRQLAVGPVAMVSLLVEAGLRGQLSEEQCPAWYASDRQLSQSEVCPEEYVKLALLTSALVGVMQIVASIINLGFIVSFLGHPVTSGFTSGAAIIIALSQLTYVLGYKVEKSEYVIVQITNIIKGLSKTNYMTLALGLTFLVGLFLNKKVAARYKRIQLLGALGPLISCIIGSLLLYFVSPLIDDYKVGYVGKLQDGIFPVTLFDLNVEDVPKVIWTAISACFIGYMESIAIGKNLASKHGYEIEAGQELFALGMANLIGGMFACYPVTGSFSRSAVNNSTGAVTQFAGLVTSVVMLITLLCATPLFTYLPQFVLAAIVINSVIPLVAIGEAKRLWRVKKLDFLLWVVAFLGTLLAGVLLGIVIAVILSLLIVIYESARPQLTILWRIPGSTIYRNVKQESSGVFIPNVFICRIGSSMYFANASFIKDMLLAYVTDLEDVNRTEYLVLEMTPVVSIDSTAVHVIQDIVNDFRSRGVQTAFAMVGNRVEKTLRKAKALDFIGQQWFFPTVNDAVHWCLRHQAAKKLMKTQITNVSNEDVSRVQNVTTGNEIGFSNDMHHDCTMLFISLLNDIPMIMSDITLIFQKNKITVVRADIDPKGENGAKHTYLVQSLKVGDKNRVGAKLLDHETDRIREELNIVLAKHGKKPNGAIPQGSFIRQTSDTTVTSENARIVALEDQLRKQGERLEKLMQIQEATLLYSSGSSSPEKPSTRDTSAEDRAERGEAASKDEEAHLMI